MKYYYPAIFRPKPHNSDGYDVKVVDIGGCLTHGDDVAECMWMAQDAIGIMLEGVAEADYPVPSKIPDVSCPAGSFVSFVCFDKTLYDETSKARVRRAVLSADNPIKELLERRRLKIKELADALGAPYRTVQDWSAGVSKPPAWVLNLILDRVL